MKIRNNILSNIETVIAVSSLTLFAGCTKYIHSEGPKTVETEVRRFDDLPVVDSDWSYEADIAATPGNGQVTFRIEAQRFKTCSTKSHRILRSHEYVENQWASSFNKFWIHSSAAVGFGLLVGGLVSHYALSNSLTKDVANENFPNDRSMDKVALSSTGLYVAMGAANSALMVPIAIGTDILALDSNVDLGERDDITTTSSKCETGAAQNQPLSYFGASATTNAAGIGELTITDVALLNSGESIKIAGRELPSKVVTEYVNSLQEKAKAERVAARQAAADAFLDAEISAGKCSPEREGMLRKVFTTVESMFKNGRGLSILDFDIVVASTSATPISFKYPSTGTYHLFSIGFAMSTFSGGSGHSGYETAMGNLTGGIVSTAVVQVSRSNQPTLSLTGRGCTLVVLAEEL